MDNFHDVKLVSTNFLKEFSYWKWKYFKSKLIFEFILDLNRVLDSKIQIGHEKNTEFLKENLIILFTKSLLNVTAITTNKLSAIMQWKNFCKIYSRYILF